MSKNFQMCSFVMSNVNFSFHNETVNIWTHLIGFVIFVGLLAWDIFLVIPQLRNVK